MLFFALRPNLLNAPGRGCGIISELHTCAHAGYRPAQAAQILNYFHTRVKRDSKSECLARKHFDNNDPNVAMGSSPDQSLLAALAVKRAQPAPIAKVFLRQLSQLGAC